MFRTCLLALAFVVGGFLPQLHVLQPLLPFLIIYMLVPVFLRMRFSVAAFDKGLILTTLANLILPFVFWKVAVVCGLNRELALALFFIAIAPPAVGCPVIVSLIGGHIAYVVTGLVLMVIADSILIPIALPYLVADPDPHLTVDLVKRILLITAVPLLIARVYQWIRGRARAVVLGRRLAKSTFYTWITIVIIVAANAITFMRDPANDLSHHDLLIMGVCAFLMAVIQFALGYLIGMIDHHRRECSQLLGQKNTSYAIYLALSSGMPVAALGPAFYVFFHNIWNGIQIARAPQGLSEESSHSHKEQKV